MTAQPIAQGLAGLGRNGDSMLVHMQPREVAGLQSLAMAHGGSLTINPETGLPEAGFLGDVLGAVAPVAIGGLLSMTGMGPLAAGLLTGAATWAATGDPLKGVMGGFGAYGGYGLGDDLANFAVAKTPEVAKTALAGSTAAGANAASNTASMLSGPGVQLGANAIPTTGLDSILSSTAGQGAIAPVANAASSTGTTFANLSSGASKALSDPIGFFKSTPNGWRNAMTVASPFLSMGAQAPAVPKFATPESNYEGPYVPAPRELRMPTAEEQLQLDAAGTPEWNYFTPSNPVPGYQTLAQSQRFAEGGSITQGGVMPLYGSPDNSGDGNQLSHDGFGLGRLNKLYGGGTFQYADGGAIPQVGGPQMPMGIPQTGGIGMPSLDMESAGIKQLLNQAIRDPMGRTMAKGGYLDGPGDGMSDSIPATINGAHPARLADGEFVVPADVVSHLGNGSTKAGAKVLYGMMDKVRKARTGTKKQGRQINPRKFMPA